jgi:hypothetical protein
VGVTATALGTIEERLNQYMVLVGSEERKPEFMGYLPFAEDSKFLPGVPFLNCPAALQVKIVEAIAAKAGRPVACGQIFIPDELPPGWAVDSDDEGDVEDTDE